MSKALSLYTMTDDFKKYMESETDEEMASALADITAGQIEKKSEGICQFLAVMESTAESFKAEEQRIANARKAIENKVKAVRDRMKDCLLAANIDKLSAGTFKISVSMTAGSLVIDDETRVPARYVTVVPEQHIPDKAAIKAAIKNGEPCDYAHIEAGTALRIK